jgi:hypothetical protein
MKAISTSMVAAILAAGFIAGPAGAQEKKAEAGSAKFTEVASDAKFHVFIVSYKPGDVRPAESSRNHRVSRALKGGMLERQYADGKTERREWKTGETHILQPGPTAYATKNVGTTDVELYTVELK